MSSSAKATPGERVVKDMRRDVPDIFAEGPWRLGRQAWLSSLIRTARGAVDDDYGMVASAIAFSSFLALLPLLGAIVLVYGMATPADRVAENVRTLLFSRSRT